MTEKVIAYQAVVENPLGRSTDWPEHCALGVVAHRRYGVDGIDVGPVIEVIQFEDDEALWAPVETDLRDVIAGCSLISTPEGARSLAAKLIEAADAGDQVAGEVTGFAPATYDLIAHLRRQIAFSGRTFGPGSRAGGIVAHITKELDEIKAAPGDLAEWVDVILLALDGAWRTGASPEAVVTALAAKQAKNETRSWPDWREMPEDGPIEHVRSEVPSCR